MNEDRAEMFNVSASGQTVEPVVGERSASRAETLQQLLNLRISHPDDNALWSVGGCQSINQLSLHIVVVREYFAQVIPQRADCAYRGSVSLLFASAPCAEEVCIDA